MKPRRVDQILAGYTDGDAISKEACCMRGTIRKLGFESEIFVPVDRTCVNTRDDCRPVESYSGSSGDMVIYHYSTASSVASSIFLRTPARKVVRYHNITPASFFEGFDDSVAEELKLGRYELGNIISKADELWAVSEFNAAELKAAGAERVKVVPLFFSLDDLALTPDHGILAQFGGRRLKNILFVGRMAPNKCVEDLISAFGWLNKCIDSATRLMLVGSEMSCPRYYAMLRMLAGRLGLSNVVFARFLTGGQLAAYYQAADLFVCASRHEGYCLPLIEAMYYGVPVVARCIGGMPEAMGGAGVMFDNAGSRVLAELLHRMLVDDGLRQEIITSQTKRISEIKARNPAEEMKVLIDAVFR